MGELNILQDKFQHQGRLRKLIPTPFNLPKNVAICCRLSFHFHKSLDAGLSLHLSDITHNLDRPCYFTTFSINLLIFIKNKYYACKILFHATTSEDY